MTLEAALRRCCAAVVVVASIVGCAAAPVIGTPAAPDEADAGVLTLPHGKPIRIRYDALTYTGKARFEWTDGRVYSGDFVQGRPQGHGIERAADGGAYDGEWNAGERSGTGRLTLADGSRYEGQFDGGVRSGRGVLHSAIGTYDGEWAEDQPNGNGRFDYNDGATYTGVWSAGARNGSGRYSRSDGATYDGDWQNDLPDGFGRLDETDHSAYEGGWRRGQRTGYGALQFGDGFGYEGTWVDNTRQGYGRERLPDGSDYVGEWLSDKRHGLGRLLSADGSSHDGSWSANAPAGPGSRHYADGIDIRGEWSGDLVTNGIVRLRSGATYRGNLYDAKLNAVDRNYLAWLERAGHDGEPSAALLLGHAYRYFDRPAANPDTASRWYERAADGGIADAQYRLAELDFDAGSPQRGLELLATAAALGHAAANTRLGAFCQLGTYLPKDHAKAVRYYEAAVAKSDLTARNNLAWLLATSPGDDVRDGARAVALALPLAAAYDSWGYLDTFAAAQAEAGDFAGAVRTERRALARAEGSADADALRDLAQRLTLFEANQPFRDP